MTRILLTGGEGQLGQAFVADTQANSAAPAYQLIALGRTRLNICDQKSIQQALASYRPDVLINAAAYTAVDQAEIDVEAAFAVNAEAAAVLAAACAASEIGFIHLSTDYVFDGAKKTPYEVNDPPKPLNIYGQSKLAGERAVLTAYPEAVIVRTAWLYSEFGDNFQTRILRAAKDKLLSGEPLRVVNDQWGSPTYAPDLVDFLIRLSLAKQPCLYSGRVLHFSGDRMMSRLALAEQIVLAAVERGELKTLPRIEAACTDDYPSLAKRPVNSALKSSER